MKIAETIKNNDSFTIGFIGDSVTYGCFECFDVDEHKLETVYEQSSSFASRMKEIFALLYPNKKCNIINAGISGDKAFIGAQRFEKDILSYNPDFVVISYGLNDSTFKENGLQTYLDSIEKIILLCKERNIETIFLTQNYMNKNVYEKFETRLDIKLANQFKEIQNDKILDNYFDKAKTLCKKHNVRVLDARKVWDILDSNGVNTDNLLANHLNHPVREYHYYVAIKLIEAMFEINLNN